MKTLTTAIFSLLLIGSAQTWAAQTNNQETGSVSASFLDINPSVRHAALGGEQAAASGHFSDYFSNPAGLRTMTLPELWLSHHESFLESRYQNLGFGLPMKSVTAALSTQFISEGSIDRVSVDNANAPVLDQGTIRPTTLSLQGGLAASIGPRLMAGLTAKGFKEKLDKTTVSGFAADGGLLWKSALPNLDLGLVARNIGPAVNGYDLPRAYAAGAAFHLRPRGAALDRLSLFAQTDLASHRPTAARFGLEIQKGGVAFRGGYQNSSDLTEDPLSQFAFGASMKIKGWGLDYAFVPSGDLGDQHRMAVSIGFGMTPEEQRKLAQKIDQSMENRMKDLAESHFQKACESSAAGRWDEAAEEFSQTLYWNPDHKTAREKLELAKFKRKESEIQLAYTKGLSQLDRGRWIEAMVEFKTVMALSPNHTGAKKHLALAQRKIDQSVFSGQKMDAASEAAFKRGLNQFMNGRLELALADWKKLQQGGQTSDKLEEYIARAEAKLLRNELEEMKKAKPDEKDKVEQLFQRGYTLYGLGQLKEAAQTWERALALDPGHHEVKRALKDVRSRLALTGSDESVAYQSPSDRMNTAALNAYVEGDIQRAIAIWKEALKVDPNNQKIRNNLSRALGEVAYKPAGAQ